MQLDMFDPPHVALRKEAKRQLELASPYIVRGGELERQAVAACPHDELDWVYVYHEDEYGRSLEYSTQIKVWCKFCKEEHYVYKRDMKDRTTDRDIFNMRDVPK